MAITLYEASVPRVIRILDNLSHILVKTQAYIDAGHVEEQALFNDTLIDDMYPFYKQVQIACDKARSLVARLAGEQVPYYPDSETTIVELKTRVQKSIQYLKSVSQTSINAAEDTTITLPVTGEQTSYPAKTLTFSHSIPNVFFHMTTAYNILRKNGVPVGKRDFLGPL